MFYIVYNILKMSNCDRTCNQNDNFEYTSSQLGNSKLNIADI